MIYHYTCGLHLRSILTCGLHPSNLLMPPGVKPILWFSKNTNFENTVVCMPGVSSAMAHEQMLKFGGLFRIGCDESVAPYRWQEVRDIACIPAKQAMRLYRKAIAVGARPGEWRATLEVVPVSQFRTVEGYTSDAWVLTSEIEFVSYRNSAVDIKNSA